MSRKQISPRLRFQILNRDNHECKYCGLPAGNGIQLQVDHVIPVKEGGDNSIGNLITSCFECNSGKGSKISEELVKDIYKTKIQENSKKHLDLFFEWWNYKGYGNIDKNTIALMSILHTYHLQGDSYKQWLSFPPFSEGEDYKKLDIEFKLGGEYCDKILGIMQGPFLTSINNKDECFCDIDESLSEVQDDSIWKNDCEDNMCYRLNYHISSYLYSLYCDGEYKNDYMIQKYSYFYNEIKDGEK